MFALAFSIISITAGIFLSFGSTPELICWTQFAATGRRICCSKTCRGTVRVIAITATS